MHLRPSHYVKLTPNHAWSPGRVISQFNWLECQGKPLWWSGRVSGMVAIIFPYQSLCELCLWTCMDLYQFDPLVEHHDMQKIIFFPRIYVIQESKQPEGCFSPLFNYLQHWFGYLSIHRMIYSQIHIKIHINWKFARTNQFRITGIHKNSRLQDWQNSFVYIIFSG